MLTLDFPVGSPSHWCVNNVGSRADFLRPLLFG